MMYRVTVKEDYRWNDAQVSGRTFSKRTVVEIGEAAMNDEIRNSPLLDVEEVSDAKEKVKAAKGKGTKGKADLEKEPEEGEPVLDEPPHVTEDDS